MHLTVVAQDDSHLEWLQKRVTGELINAFKEGGLKISGYVRPHGSLCSSW